MLWDAELLSQQLIVGMDLPANQAIPGTTTLAPSIAVLYAPSGMRSREQHECIRHLRRLPLELRRIELWPLVTSLKLIGSKKYVKNSQSDMVGLTNVFRMVVPDAAPFITTRPLQHTTG